MKTINPTGRSVRFTSSNAVAAVASDTKMFDAGQLYVGTGGDIKVMMAQGSDWVTYTNVPDGCFMPIEVIGIHTDTTASDILILY